jgi:GR25 family glycosyltransferase involved in LPS biosynthesis
MNKLKYYIINETHRTDRKENMIKQMEYINEDNYEFFKAFGKENPRVRKAYDFCMKNNKYRFINKIGAVGVLYSTIELYKYINKKGEDYAIILEDDIHFHKNYVNMFERIIPLLEENNKIDLLYLGYNLNNKELCKKFKEESTTIKNINDFGCMFFGNYGYICNKKHRDIIIILGIESFINNNITIDHGLNIVRIKKKINTFIITGKQYLIPYIFDEKCINKNRSNKQLFYKNRCMVVNNYYDFI